MGIGISVLSPKEIPRETRAKVLGGRRDLQGFADFIKSDKCENLVVLAGAGISVSAGIPDFRSPGTGLYDNLQKYKLQRPEDVFCINYFTKTSPRPFFHLAHELYPGRYFPTRTHFFLKLLEEKGKLKRLYTQNIDTLERMAGMSHEKVIEAHGSFASATCMRCKQGYTQEWVEKKIFGAMGAPVAGSTGDVIGTAAEADPVDAVTAGLAAVSVTEGGGGAASGAGATADKESADLSSVVVPMCEKPECAGHADAIVKPDITFFGEDLPERYGENVDDDCKTADALIVIGTSLKVHPVASIPGKVTELCPRLLINREAVNEEDPGCDTEVPVAGSADPTSDDDGRPWTNNSKFRFFLKDNYRDVFFEGDCDDGVEALAAALGWTDDLNRIHAAAIAAFKASHPDWPGVALPSQAQLTAAKSLVSASSATAASVGGGASAAPAKSAVTRGIVRTAAPVARKAPEMARTSNPMRSAAAGASSTSSATKAAAGSTATGGAGSKVSPVGAASRSPVSAGSGATRTVAVGARSGSTSPAKATTSAATTAAARTVSGAAGSTATRTSPASATSAASTTGSASATCSATSPAAASNRTSSLGLGRVSPAVATKVARKSPVSTGGGAGGSPAARSGASPAGSGAKSTSPATSSAASASKAAPGGGAPVRRSPLSTAGARVLGSTSPATGTGGAASASSSAAAAVTRTSPASATAGATATRAVRKTPSPVSSAGKSTTSTVRTPSS